MAFVKVLCVVVLALMTTTTNAQATPSSSDSSRMRASSAGSSSHTADSDEGVSISVPAPSNATGSSSGSTVSVWTTDDICSAVTVRSGCTFAATCDKCLSRMGCAIESTTGLCVSTSLINPSLAGVTYFPAGEATYCDATDAACESCRHSTSDAPCYGENGCFCLRECEIQSTEAIECHALLSFSQFAYFLFAASVIAPISIWIHMRRARRQAESNAAQGVGGLVFRRRRRDPEPHPMALKLDNWKKDCEDLSSEFNGLELSSCFIQMNDQDSDDCRASASLRDSQRGTVASEDARSQRSFEFAESGIVSDVRAGSSSSAQARHDNATQTA
uniref:Membrane-associated protein n=1 Tax=Globisporangium ultimum (strain ATCC 200006 / CBS 805.95 / DAOM BR144) TaxID=431595 RepID=K3WQ11_GLOUD